MDYLKYNLKEGYEKIYPFYELNNHLMTLGLDVMWRKKASKIIIQNLEPVLNEENFVYCDLCTGTGEFFQKISNKLVRNTKNSSKTFYIGVDFNFNMLSFAKAKKYYNRENTIFILADVGWLPFKTNSINLITISWGIRNLRNANGLNISECIFMKRFKEVYRVIKPGGYFWGLETSRPPNKLIRKISDIFVLYFSTNVAKIISGDFKTYTYLAKSIIDFFDAESFKKFLIDVGFKKVNYTLFTFGIAALHCAKK